MNYVTNLEPFDVNESRTVYDAGPVFYITAPKDAVLADHTHDEAETLTIVSGTAEIQIGEKVEVAKAPCVVKIPSGIYHKFTAKTKVDFIEQRQDP